MWSRLFSSQEMTKSKLLELTLKNFHPFPTCEVELLFQVTRDMLKNLNEASPDFDEQFNKIVFGTMVLSLVIETKKYGTPLYPYNDTHSYDIIAVLRSLHNHPAMEKFISDIGEKVLSNELPFDANYIDNYFPTLAKNVPSIKQRFEKYAPQSIENVNNTQIADSEDQNRWRFCNII